MMSKQAFTLIELLVVVLIIGILAAVALPQYQKAVAKARTVEFLTIINAAEKALTSYYLAHGGEDKDFFVASGGQVSANQLQELDITIPITAQLIKDYNWYIAVDETGWGVNAGSIFDGGIDLSVGAFWNETRDGECVGWSYTGIAMCKYLQQLRPAVVCRDGRGDFEGAPPLCQ